MQEEFPKIGYEYQLNLIKLLERAAKLHPQGEIIYKNLMRENYTQAYERCQRLSSALMDMGVKRGSKVITFEWNSLRFFEIYFAVPGMGAIMHMGNPLLTPEQITYIVNQAEDEVLILNKEFIPLIESINHKLKTVRQYIVLTDEEEKPSTKLNPVSEYEELLRSATPHFEYPELNENLVASLSNTTGTTGEPKICFFTHRQNILHTMVWTIMLLGFSGEKGFDPRRDVMIPLVPMFHAHGWSLPYMATLLGCEQVYPGKYAPASLLSLIEQEKVTFSHCVPTILHLLMHHPKFHEVDLSGWKVMIGGAALPKAMCKAAMQRGIDIYSGYGMSETCPILTISHVTERDLPEDEELDIRCMTGRPLPLVDLKVVDEEMNQVPRDGESVGEIVVRAPWLTQGYLKDRRNSENLWQGGWLHTADVAWMNDKRYVKITDRIKDVIKTGGEWISSLEIEDLLITHPGIAEVAVIGTPDVKWGEVPLALVVKKADTDISEKELRRHIKGFVDRGIISRQVILLKVRFVDTIDKTSVGKINKRLLREKYAEMETQ